MKVLTDLICKEVISWHEHYNMMNVRACPDVCEPQGLHKNRLDYNIAQIFRDKRTQWFFDLLKDFLLTDYPDNRVNEGEFFYLHRWDEGNKFEKHIDKRREDSWHLVVGASLNDDYEGGKLLCYNPDIEIASTKGELYKMGAEVLHEVTEITSGTRYSFVYFIKQPLLYPKKQLL